jgi:hypothetical protein
MAPESVSRLRLRYEDSLGQCNLCGRRGMVGADIKLVLTEQGEPSPREHRGTGFMLRCADPVACRQRRLGDP